jgi:hypothetical protein
LLKVVSYGHLKAEELSLNDEPEVIKKIVDTNKDILTDTKQVIEPIIEETILEDLKGLEQITKIDREPFEVRQADETTQVDEEPIIETVPPTEASTSTVSVETATEAPVVTLTEIIQQADEVINEPELITIKDQEEEADDAKEDTTETVDKVSIVNLNAAETLTVPVTTVTLPPKPQPTTTLKLQQKNDAETEKPQSISKEPQENEEEVIDV